MGACQMVTREAFDAVGGFDEAYQVAMSDVALCLQLWRAGYRTAYAPAGALVHHEGATRGKSNPAEDMRRLADDIRALGIDEDPYLHPGLDGGHATPRLRSPGGEGPGEALRRLISEVGSTNLLPRISTSRMRDVCWHWSSDQGRRCFGPHNPPTKSPIPGVRRVGRWICYAGAQTSALAFPRARRRMGRRVCALADC